MLEKACSKVKVIFSFIAVGIHTEDYFCFDHSDNDGLDWHSEKCWYSYDDLESGLWYHDVASELKL